VQPSITVGSQPVPSVRRFHFFFVLFLFFLGIFSIIHVAVPVVQIYADKPAAIQLALKTLGSFNLQEKLLTEFVREVVVGFLDDDDPYHAPPTFLFALPPVLLANFFFGTQFDS
jgi:hypothetical protein